MRAVELADAALDTESGFLANLGRPARESASAALGPTTQPMQSAVSKPPNGKAIELVT